MLQQEIQHWLEAHKDVLASNEIAVSVIGFERWELPSSTELHRLGRISGYRIPDVFGPPEGEQAVQKFGEGDVNGCMEMFKRMLADKEASHVRNNLAFCQIMAGDLATGLSNATKAVEGDYEPLFEMNKGIAEFLQGNAEAAKQSLRNALEQLRAPDSRFDASASYVLVLAPTRDKTQGYPGVPVDAAILINLWRMGDLSRAELEKQLTELCSDKAKGWMELFPDCKTE